MTTLLSVLGVILIGTVVTSFADALLEYRVDPETRNTASRVHNILTSMTGIAMGIVMANGIDMFKF